MRNSRLPLIQKLAREALARSAITAPPVPIDDLVKTEGLAIFSGASRSGSGHFDREGWRVRLSGDLFVETPLNRNRRRFTLAHELGHCLLDHGGQACWELATLGETVSLKDVPLPNYESEANAFARELLLPQPWLERDWLAKQDAAHWARLYGVSTATLFIVLDERQLLMQMRRKK